MLGRQNYRREVLSETRWRTLISAKKGTLIRKNFPRPWIGLGIGAVPKVSARSSGLFVRFSKTGRRSILLYWWRCMFRDRRRVVAHWLKERHYTGIDYWSIYS